MRYTKELQTRVIRTRHRITLIEGGTAGELLNAMKNVPEDAKLVDIAADDDGNTILLFEQERRDP